MVLVFGRESDFFALLLAFPTAKGVGLQVINFDWPIPWHLYNLGDSSEIEVRFWFFCVFTSDFPEKGFDGFGRL